MWCITGLGLYIDVGRIVGLCLWAGQMKKFGPYIGYRVQGLGYRYSSHLKLVPSATLSRVSTCLAQANTGAYKCFHCIDVTYFLRLTWISEQIKEFLWKDLQVDHVLTTVLFSICNIQYSPNSLP
jgi:hypothetical protein